jgi:hypothetical protein
MGPIERRRNKHARACEKERNETKRMSTTEEKLKSLLADLAREGLKEQKPEVDRKKSQACVSTAAVTVTVTVAVACFEFFFFSY